ncbi:FUSC family protein [Variovorax sp. J22P168]|uniref:FUSC family protein n=1 Tax=Variovorax jilinensis TaxID=3053513 RepID=UPI002577F66C|nr:FUSC family protein [Variovorax sp. J22P168]MDM0015559.1 FUSC family protein [Variovorax sp. J22P168]
MTQDDPYRKASWVHELTRLQSAPWPRDVAVRAAICVGIPLALGLVTDRFVFGFLVALGTLNMAAAEGAGSYRSRFRDIAICAPIAASGYLAGYLAVLPYPAVVVAMTVLAFLAGIVNSYGKALSLGTMQALMLAAIAIGLPQMGPFWQPALLYLAGAVFYALVLAVEAAMDFQRPERAIQADEVAALANLARARADEAMAGQASPQVRLARREAIGRSQYLHPAIVDANDRTFAAIMAETDPAALRSAAAWLGAMAMSVRRRAAAPPVSLDPTGKLAHGLAQLAGTIGAGDIAAKAEPPSRLDNESGRAWFSVERPVLLAAASLALCMGTAFAMKGLVAGVHWYWIPMTVALVMKPDLGSVFARAVLRCLGTSVGVVIGAAVMILLPKGTVLVLVVVMFAALLPWAKSLSYAAQAVVFTPLVLILVDLIAPTTHNIDYGEARLVATLVGAAIALVLGYFIWPRRHGDLLASEFSAVMSATADYLVAGCSPGDASTQIVAARGIAYARLAKLRATLARLLAEPPPAGREASEWIPFVDAAEELCTRIGAHAAGRDRSGSRPTAAELAVVADRLRGISASTSPATAADIRVSDAFLAEVAAEAARIADRFNAIALKSVTR